MKLFNKILLTVAIGMSLMAVTGCGSINPKDIEGAYKNDERTYYLYHSGAIETGNKERIEKFEVYTTTPKSNYKGKQYYDYTPNIIIDNEGNVCDQEIIGGKQIIGKIDKNKLIITQARIGFSASLSEGEYIKTDEKLPTKEELKYTSFKASAEKHRDEAPKGVTTLSPKFHELIKKQGKGWN